MKFILIIIFFAATAFYVTNKLKTDNEFLSLYVTWSTTLVLINLLVTLFIYMFTHSVKNSKGNVGVKGKIGRRGEEGKPKYCNFCSVRVG